MAPPLATLRTRILLPLCAVFAVPAAAFAAAAAASVAASAPAALPPLGSVAVNMVDLYWSYAGYSAGGNATFARASMAAACGVPRRLGTLVRFAALPFWPAQLNASFLADEPLYWRTLDALVADAAAAGCKLMPSFFWNLYAMGDAFGEPGGVVFDEALGPSRARAAMEAFAAAFVARYPAGGAVAAFETGNEYNLFFDLNATQQQPCICVACGSPAARTSADNVSTAAGAAVQARLLAVIRAADGGAGRPVSSGHAMARPDATWRRDNYRNAAPPPEARDTLAQFLAITAQQQAGVDLMSQHIYAGPDNERFGETDPYSPAVLGAARQAAAAAGQTLLVGEFGDSAPGNRTFTRNVLALLGAWRAAEEGSGAPFFGLVWAWELLQQADSFSLWPGRDDAIIDAIVQHNAGGA